MAMAPSVMSSSFIVVHPANFIKVTHVVQ